MEWHIQGLVVLAAAGWHGGLQAQASKSTTLNAIAVTGDTVTSPQVTQVPERASAGQRRYGERVLRRARWRKRR